MKKFKMPEIPPAHRQDPKLKELLGNMQKQGAELTRMISFHTEKMKKMAKKSTKETQAAQHHHFSEIRPSLDLLQENFADLAHQVKKRVEELNTAILEKQKHLLHQEQEKRNTFHQELTRSSETFNLFYTKIKDDLTKNQLDSHAVDHIKRNFDEQVIKANKEQPNPNTFQTSLAQLKHLIKKLQEEIAKQRRRIDDKQLEDIHKDITSTMARIQEKIKLGRNKLEGLNLSQKEKKAIKELDQGIPHYTRSKLTLAEATGFKKNILEIEKNIDKTLQALEPIIQVHEQAKKIIGNSFSNLIEVINRMESKDAIDLLKTMLAYTQFETLEKYLADHLHQLNNNACKAVSEFIETSESNKKEEFQQKLTCINILSAEGITQQGTIQTVLQNPELIMLIKQLADQKLNQYINEAMLKNENLLEALTVLNNNGLDLTESMIKGLHDDPNKCALIVCQNKLNHFTKAHYPRLDADCFKKFLSELIQIDSKTAAALYQLQQFDQDLADKSGEPPPPLCTPWLMIVAKEDKALIQMLSTKSSENLKNIATILRVLFDKDQKINHISLVHYLQEKENTPAFAADKYKTLRNSLTENASVFEALATAVQSNNSVLLSKTAEFVAEINKYKQECKKHYSPKDYQTIKASLESFLKAAIPILLNQDVTDKRQRISDCAQNIFKHRNEWRQKVIEFVVDIVEKLFSPIKSFTDHRFFREVKKTERQKQVEALLDKITSADNTEVNAPKPDTKI